MTGVAADQRSWWGTFEVAIDTCWQLRVGPASLWVQRLAGEWRLAHEHSEDDVDLVAIDRAVSAPPDVLADDVIRIAVGGDDTRIHIEPRLPDRPIVSAPQHPVTVPGGNRVTMYISTPLWMGVSLGDGGAILQEFAIQQPSDTWFGHSTREGELCYASRPSCRVRLAEIIKRPHRSITAVSVHNKSAAPMTVSRMQVPVAYLSLFEATDGGLWTNDIELTHEGEDLAPVKIRDGAPRSASKATEIAAPRSPRVGNLLIRAFGNVFGR